MSNALMNEAGGAAWCPGKPLGRPKEERDFVRLVGCLVAWENTLLAGSGYACTQTTENNRWVPATNRGDDRMEDEKGFGLARSPRERQRHPEKRR